MNRRIISVVGMLCSICPAAMAAPQTAPPVATFSAPAQAEPTQAPSIQSEPMRIEVAPAAAPLQPSPVVSGGSFSAGLRPLASESPANHAPTSLVGDASVQTVSYETPLPLQAADQMLQLVAAPPGAGESAGTPLSLREALRMAPSDQRLPLTRAYWRCFEAQAKLASARYIENQVNQLAGSSSLEGPLVQAERAMAAAEIVDAESALRDAQVQLLRYLPPQLSRTLPLPSSLPLVSEYLTNYETLAARRGLDPRLQGIDLRLVEGLANLTALADSAWQTRDLLARLIPAFNQAQKNLAETMYAIGTCRRAHDAFYHAVALYNQDIASYAFAVAPSSLPAEQAVAMLIKVDREPSPNPTRQADAMSVMNTGGTPAVRPNASLGTMSIDRSAGTTPSATAADAGRLSGTSSNPAAFSNGAPPIVSPSGNRPASEPTNTFPVNTESSIRAASSSPFPLNSGNVPSSGPPPTSASFQLGSPSSPGGSSPSPPSGFQPPSSQPPSSQPPSSQQTPQPKSSSGFPTLGR